MLLYRNYLRKKQFYCMQRCFCHWRTITEQSMESLSATFIAKFHVSALSAGRNSTVRDLQSSSFCEILTPRQDIPKIISQYQASLLSSKSGIVKDSFVELPVKSSTPLLPLCDKKSTTSLSSATSNLQIDTVKRQLFNDDEDIMQSSSFKLSPPCHCLNTGVVNQLASLQQDLDSSINILESNLSQGSSSLVSSDLTNEGVLSHSDNIISPPMEFSEQCHLPCLPVSSIETVSTISTQMSMESYSNHTLSRHFSNEITLGHSYMLFTRLLSVVKLMQHYPVSVVFVAWRRFVQKRKSLTVLKANVHYTVHRNIMMNAFTVWKIHTYKVLKCKRLEISFWEKFRKRNLSTALQRWITVYHKRLKDNVILSDLLISRNQYIVKYSFFKWKHDFEIKMRIGNHLVNM